MAKYRKKPIVIEAVQCVVGLPIPDGVRIDFESPTHFSIDTLEGKHIVSPWDYIITGIAGEKYPCKPDIFEATYELVEED